MRKKNRSPFGEILPKIVAVCKGDRTVYFASYGWLTTVLNPIDEQEDDRRQARIMTLVYTAAKRLAEKLNIPETESEKYYFRRTVNGVEIEPRNFMEDLEPAEKEQVLLLQNEAKGVDIRATTLLMQYRLAYSLEVVQIGLVGATQLQVRDPWFDVQMGARFRFDNTTIVITQPYNTNTGFIGIQPLSAQLDAGSTGFLLAKDGIGYALGDSSWTEDDTRKMLTTRIKPNDPPGQIQEIYAFYQNEVSGKDSTKALPPGSIEETSLDTSEVEEPKGFTNDGESFKTTLALTPSTGEISSGNSNTSDATMNGSVTPTLATAQPG